MVLKVLLIVLILWNWVFSNFTLAGEVFSKALRSVKTCVLVNKNVSAKFYSPLKSSKIFDKCIKATSVPFFIPDFDLSSCKIDKFTFKVLY